MTANTDSDLRKEDNDTQDVFFDEPADELENIEELHSLNDENLQGDAVQLYFKNISKYKPHSMEEEQELGRLIRKGDTEALKKLILSNLRFVVSIANKYRNTGLPLADIISQGNIGLLEAAKRYDPDKGVKFITYAVWWIRQAIIQGLAEQSVSVRLPVKQASILYRINSASEKLVKKLNRQPTIEELSKATGIDEADITDITRATRSELSLDAPVGENGDSFFIDTLRSSSRNAEEEIIQKTLKASIDEIISDLDEREAKIIMQRFGLDEGEAKTLEEIGKEMNISRERVRQIEAKAMEKLKKKALKKRLNDFLN